MEKLHSLGGEILTCKQQDEVYTLHPDTEWYGNEKGCVGGFCVHGASLGLTALRAGSGVCESQSAQQCSDVCPCLCPELHSLCRHGPVQ